MIPCSVKINLNEADKTIEKLTKEVERKSDGRPSYSHNQWEQLRSLQVGARRYAYRICIYCQQCIVQLMTSHVMTMLQLTSIQIKSNCLNSEFITWRV